MEALRSIFLKIAVLAGIVLSAFIVYISVKEIQRGKQIENEIENLRREAEKIESGNNQLQEKISYLSTQEFRERAAKEKLNLQKPDEKVVIVKPSVSLENIEESTAGGGEEEIKEEIPNYLKWHNQFFGY